MNPIFRSRYSFLALLAIMSGLVSGMRAYPQDASRSDSVQSAADTTAIQDTLRSRFIPTMGSLAGSIDSSSMLHRSNIIWTDARDFGDISWRVPGLVYRDLGEAGKPSQLNFLGYDGRGISILLDGRPLNDPITGIFNVNDMPLDFVDRIEVFSGAHGFLYGQGGATAALNFVTRQFNTLRPITKIRYSQGPSETILTDGLFTQNVARSLNLMVGFQRHVSDGRYKNAALDAWSIRTRLRYNATERLNISLTDFYNKSVNGMNGGVDIYQQTPVFDNVVAVVKDRNSSETATRRDVTLTALARLFDDSTSNSQLSFYYSTLQTDYNDPITPLQIGQGLSSKGVRFIQRYSAGVGNLEAGFDYESRKIDTGSRFETQEENLKAFFGKLTMDLGGLLTPSFSGRSEIYSGKTLGSLGAVATLHLGPNLSFFAGWSSTSSASPIATPSAKDTFLLGTPVSSDIQQRYTEAGFRFSLNSALQLSGLAYRRVTKNSTLFYRASSSALYPKVTAAIVPEVSYEGLSGSALVRLWNFEAYGTLSLTNYTEIDTVKTLIPQLVLSGELAYRNRFFDDALDARFGVRSRFMTQHKGMEFLPAVSLFVENTGAQPAAFSTLDLFAVLHIGDAFVSVTWENLLNAHYFVTPVYPMPGRSFRLGVNWVFID